MCIEGFFFEGGRRENINFRNWVQNSGFSQPVVTIVCTHSGEKKTNNSSYPFTRVDKIEAPNAY